MPLITFGFVEKRQREKKLLFRFCWKKFPHSCCAARRWFTCHPNIWRCVEQTAAKFSQKNACLIKIYERYATEDDEWYVAIVGVWTCTCARARERESFGTKLSGGYNSWLNIKMLLMTFVRWAKHEWRGDAYCHGGNGGDSDDAEDDNITSQTYDILVQHDCH